MLVTRRSLHSGIERTFDLPITQAEYDAWKNGTLIQNAFPQLTPDQREFMMTGITAEEWDEMFGESEEDETFGD